MDPYLFNAAPFIAKKVDGPKLTCGDATKNCITCTHNVSMVLQYYCKKTNGTKWYSRNNVSKTVIHT